MRRLPLVDFHREIRAADGETCRSQPIERQASDAGTASPRPGCSGATRTWRRCDSPPRGVRSPTDVELNRGEMLAVKNRASSSLSCDDLHPSRAPASSPFLAKDDGHGSAAPSELA